MESYLLIGATLFLIAGFAHTLLRVHAGKLRPGRFNLASIIGAFLLLSVDLWFRGQVQRSCPLYSLFDVLLFMAWATALLYFLVGSAYRLSLLGVFTSPLVLLLLLTAQLAPLSRAPATPSIRDPWIEFHAALSLIAYGAFALAGIAGLMFLVQDRQLKKRMGGSLLYNLPPITDLAIANTRLIRLGLVILTIAFAAGFLSGMPVNTLKFWTSATIWAAYGILVLLRQIHTLAPRKTAILSVAALGFVLITLPAIQHLSSAK